MAHSQSQAKRAKTRKNKAVPQGRNSADWVRRGQKYDHSGDEKKAMQCYLEAFNLDPRNIEALKLLSRKLIKLTERRMAIEVLEQAVAANPDDMEVYLILGNLALEMRMLDAALQFFTIVSQSNPNDPVGYNNMATVLREQEKFDDAITLLQEVLPHFPTSAPLWNTLATVVGSRDGIDAAIPFYEEALRLDPQMHMAWSNLSRSLEACGRFEESIEAAQKAIAINEQATEAHYTMGTALLALGRLEEGWQECEWRQHYRRPSSLRFILESERWDGQDLTGKTLVICPEQGVGDEYLFTESFADIVDKPAQCYIGCDPRLVKTLQRTYPNAIVGSYKDGFHNNHRYRDLPFLRQEGISPDYYIECGSLWKFHRPTVESFPKNRQGFLTPDPARVAYWKEKLDALGPGPKVGIGWRSGMRNNERNRHYVLLDQWGPIFDVPGVHFVNLQYDDCAAELQAAQAATGTKIHVMEGLDLKQDLEDVGALIAALDIVLSPAIAPGAMALAFGTPFWVLARKAPWWLFGNNAEGDSSPIGPTKLFTYDAQFEGREGWDRPVAAVAKELANQEVTISL